MGIKRGRLLTLVVACAAAGGIANDGGAVAAESAGADIVTGVGAGAPPAVKVFSGSSGAVVQSFLAYDPGFAGGVRVAAGDVNGDGFADIVTGAGPTGAPLVKVFSGADGSLLSSFLAYDPAFTGGIFVAAGDVDGDGYDDVVTGADAGGAPHVKVFSGADGSLLRSFFAYDPSFAGGVRVAAGDVNGDGLADLVTGSGPRAGSQVKVISGADGSLLASFFAYDPAFTGGIFVAAGDVDGDGHDDVVTGTDATAGPQVKVFSGADGSVLRSFFAYDPTFTGGVRVAAGDVDADGFADILTATGTGVAAHVKAFRGTDVAEIRSFLPYGTFAGGAYVAGRAAGVTPPDSDGDGIPDASDPDTVGALVAALPDDAFKAPGQRTAMLSRLDDVEQRILARDIAGAVDGFSDLLKRVDGCGDSAGRDDWIVDCEAQRAIRAAIEGVIAALQP
ncbi:MAG TPA: FG-GAP-like repeat-containing protein [Gaiellaceae bacterium]|nr:FG-GAP-like repeat-containing protein [Gaiellaceae bacterium]